jgi:hypothetical protein
VLPITLAPSGVARRSLSIGFEISYDRLQGFLTCLVGPLCNTAGRRFLQRQRSGRQHYLDG